MRRRHPTVRFVASFLVVFGGCFATLTGHVFTARTSGAPVSFHGAAQVYAVSNVQLRVAAADPTRLGGVSFDLSGPARNALARVAGATASCTVSGAHADCSFASAPSLDQASSLEVAAS